MNKIKLVNAPIFHQDGKNVIYNLDEIKDKKTNIRIIQTGTLIKDGFDVFLKNSLKEGKQVCIYTIDDKFVRCAAI